ncbi:acyl-CoA-binding domain-containing protein 3-like [Rutidosis leptorrhynchoides]|uniref:acyl-CoA-binding domain-containing protein 3-like n=1 Tax=Rutidosis leptorrhynchoides TaxID=125765 RepID=UPI003A98EE59
MELFQELVFTISFSVIISLLVAKLFSIVSSFDDENPTVSIRVEEKKIDKEWVVCDSEKDPCLCFDGADDQVKVSKDEDDLGNGVVIDELKSVGGVGEHKVFDESPERDEFEDEGNVVECDFGGEVDKEVLCEIDVDEVKVEEGDGVVIDDNDDVDDDDDDEDWQGIETTELEKRFGSAVAFMGSKSSADRVNLIDNEVKIQLYGLHKVAIEGSCFEPQPMALKVSARANWNSWKRLENLGREDAMEQYIALLSQHVPDWMGRHVSDKQ